MNEQILKLVDLITPYLDSDDMPDEFEYAVDGYAIDSLRNLIELVRDTFLEITPENRVEVATFIENTGYRIPEGVTL